MSRQRKLAVQDLVNVYKDTMMFGGDVRHDTVAMFPIVEGGYVHYNYNGKVYEGYAAGAENYIILTHPKGWEKMLHRVKSAEERAERSQHDVEPHGEAQDPIPANQFGVRIDSKTKAGGHYATSTAFCSCGESLMVAPAVFHAKHQKGNPVMVCADHGVHGFYFKDLKPGVQQENGN